MAHEIPTTRRAIVKQVGALALLGSSAPVSAAPKGDAALVALGKQFELTWAKERATTNDPTVSEEDFEAIVASVSDIVEEIEKYPATTMEGLVVKARACSWTRSGEPFEDDTFSTSATTDVRLASAILRDLIAIGGTPALTS